jgi:drug/metabolite transporter (DMT)-like permease
MGLFFALIALFSWGIGDFLIQKSTRRFGSWEALFYITAFASIVLLPFVYKDFGYILVYGGYLIPLALSLLMLIVAFVEFEAFRLGKLSVIEPILAFEIPVTAILAIYVINEKLSIPQILLIFAIVAGIFLVSTKSFLHLKKIKLEAGVILAICATIGMGTVNFLFGIGARDTNPLLINWFLSVFIAIFSLGFILYKRKGRELLNHFKTSKKLILSVSIFDNIAWIAYGYAALYLPITIAIGISESYIIVASGLGLIINKEKLLKHQWAGLTLTILSAVSLAFITDGIV